MLSAAAGNKLRCVTWLRCDQLLRLEAGISWERSVTAASVSASISLCFLSESSLHSQRVETSSVFFLFHSSDISIIYSPVLIYPHIC